MSKKRRDKRRQQTRKKTQSNNLQGGAWWQNKAALASIGLMLLLAVLAYSPVGSADFTNWDDPMYVTENPVITDLSSSNLSTIFGDYVAYNYHPLTIFSLALQYRVGGANPAVYHWTNILFHLLNIVLVFHLIWLLSGGKLLPTAVSAFLFGLHPMHVESVAWIASHKDVLYGFFFLASLVFYVKYVHAKKAALLAVSCLLFLLSAMSKPSAVVLPLLLLLIDYWYDRHKNGLDAKLLTEKIPFFAIAFLFGFLTINAQTQGDAVVGNFDNFNIAQRVLFACYGLVMYVFQVLVPYKTAAYHPYPDVAKSLPAIMYLTPLLVAAMAAAVFWAAKRLNKIVVFGFLFFVVNVALVLQLVSVGSAVMADRYTYIAYIGLFFMLGYGLHYLLSEKLPAKSGQWYAVAALAAVFALGMTWLTYANASFWKNSQSLWSNVIAKYPDCSLAYNSRGNYYMDAEDFQKAKTDYEKALALEGDNARAVGNLATIYSKLGQPEKALETYNKAISLNAKQYESYYGRGNIHRDMGNSQEAKRDYERSLDVQENYEAYYGLGLLHRKMGQPQRALEYYGKAIKMRPHDSGAYSNRGNVHFDLKQYQEAINDYDQAIKRNPNDSKSHGNKGAVYFQQGQYAQAIEHFSRAIKIAPNYGQMYYFRSQAYNNIGKRPEALKDAQKAQQLGYALPGGYLEGLR